MIVVSDASPLNALVRIGQVDVLHPLFGIVVIPPAVAAELSHAGTPGVVRNWVAARPAWLEIRAPSRIDATLQIDDAGEVEAISLALELKADFLLADDRKARRVARERGVTVTGAVGVLELASARGLLDLQEAFGRLRTTDFKVSDRILREALDRDAVRKRDS
jgi:predicted nucleic acid-binding protein